jgi:hypothetical protein
MDNWGLEWSLSKWLHGTYRLPIINSLETWGFFLWLFFHLVTYPFLICCPSNGLGFRQDFNHRITRRFGHFKNVQWQLVFVSSGEVLVSSTAGWGDSRRHLKINGNLLHSLIHIMTCRFLLQVKSIPLKLLLALNNFFLLNLLISNSLCTLQMFFFYVPDIYHDIQVLTSGKVIIGIE